MFWLGFTTWTRSRRWAATLGGLTLGTTLIFAVLTTNAGSARQLEGPAGPDATVTAVSGAADAVLAELSGLAGVERVIAIDAGVVELRAGEARLDALAVGIDGADVERSYPHSILAGRLPAPGTAEVAVPAGVAAALGVDVGGELEIAASDQVAPRTVVGLLGDDGLGSVNGGGVAISPAGTVRPVAGGATLSRFDVELSDVDAEAWIQAAGATLTGGAQVERFQGVSGDFDQFMATIGVLLSAVAVLTLAASGLLVYLSQATSLAQRRQGFVVLRTLGSTRPKLWAAILGEAGALGVGAAALGLPLGWGVAVVLNRLVATASDVALPTPSPTGGSVALTLVIAVVIPMAASIGPAWRISSIAPAEGMRPLPSPPPRSPAVLAVGVGLLAGAWGASTAIEGSAKLFAGIVLAITGLLVTLPALVPVLTVPLRRVASASRGGMADLALVHLAKEKARTGFTLSLVALVLVAALVVQTAQAAIANTLGNMLDTQFGADVQVVSEEGLSTALISRLAARDDIATLSPIGFGRVSLTEGGEHNLVAIDPDTFFTVAGFVWVDGDDDTAAAQLRGGTAAVLPSPLANQLDVTTGDTLALRTATGTAELRVAGTYAAVGQSPEIGVTVSRYAARDLFGLAGDAAVYATVTPGSDPAAVVADIEAHEGGETAAFTTRTGKEYKERSLAQLAGFLDVFHVLVALVAIVGALGVANTLAATVHERRREIGLVRALGADRWRIQALSFGESLVLMIVAAVVAVPAAALLGSLVVEALAQILGFTLTFVFPWAALPVVLAAAVALAAVGAVQPARTASRVDPVTALGVE